MYLIIDLLSSPFFRNYYHLLELILCMEEECRIISKKRFDELIEAEAMLEALYAAGVDNWSGYDEAMNILDESSNVEE